MSLAHDHTPGDIIKNAYDKPVRSAASSLWQGLLSVGASGFGKGALLTAALVATGIAMYFGMHGAAETLKINGVLATAEQGFAAGMGSALEMLLFKPAGWLILAVGGTLGAVSSAVSHRNEMTALEAERLALEYARAREREQEKEKPVQLSQQAQPKIAPEPEPSVKETNFRADERRRRAEQQNKQTLCMAV